MIGKRFGLNWQKSSEKVNNQKKSPHEAGFPLNCEETIQVRLREN